MTSEQDYRRGYALGYAAAAKDANSPRLTRFLLERVMPWRYEPDPTPGPAPRLATPCGDQQAVRDALAKELAANWALRLAPTGIDRLAEIVFRAAR